MNKFHKNTDKNEKVQYNIMQSTLFQISSISRFEDLSYNLDIIIWNRIVPYSALNILII